MSKRLLIFASPHSTMRREDASDQCIRAIPKAGVNRMRSTRGGRRRACARTLAKVARRVLRKGGSYMTESMSQVCLRADGGGAQSVSSPSRTLARPRTIRSRGVVGAHGPQLLTRTLLQKLDLSADQVLRSAGLAQQVSQRSSRSTLPGPALQELLRICMTTIETEASRASGRPEFTAEDAALLCYCAVSAATLEQAIERAGRFNAALGRAAGRPDSFKLALNMKGRVAELHLSSSSTPTGFADFMTTLLGTILFLRLFSWLIGEEIELIEASTAYDRLIGEDVLAELLSYPLVFGRKDLPQGSAFRLSFAAKYLQRPVVRTCADLENLQMLDLLFAVPAGVGVSMAVRRIFNAALARGLPPPSTVRLAALCSRSGATIRRHLARESTSIRMIREECVRQHALQLLRDGTLMLSEIAARLGFSDAPCFRRAFRRWTGTSPSAYRRRPSL
jgi:AraC-like DNA-binding protein